jgi:uncharacterized protein YbcI
MATSDPISVESFEAQSNNHGELLSTISNRMVQLHKRYYGKGPTKARSYVMGDLVVCLMRGGFTKAEETLIESGRANLVHEQRSEFQIALRDEFTAAISEVMGRPVTAFMSNSHVDPPYIVEIFVLEPESNGDGSNGHRDRSDGHRARSDGHRDGSDGHRDGSDGAGPSD